ncbi:hypothetical protein MMC08_008056 [Hypocenomyce scalaris]|nr:hypothetical protein [Hypocenomyce scalaris]
MRRPFTPTLSLFLLTPLLRTALAISLSQFQTIANFPSACTSAYNSQISGCTASDFSNGDPCSTSCIAGLQSITALIDSACKGSQADPTTLIGIFFVGKGVDTLCPNYAASSAAASSATAGSSTETAIIIQTSTLVASSLSAAASSLTSASSTTSTTTSSTVSVLPIPLSQSTNTIPSPSVTPKSSTSTPTERPTFLKTAINDGSKTVLTSKAEQTSSSNPDAFGGGGSPFEISAGVKPVERAWIYTMLAVVGVVGLIGFF